MPQMQKANMCFYKWHGKQIHLLSQIHLQTAFSQLSLITTVKVIEATVPQLAQRTGKNQMGPGTADAELALSEPQSDLKPILEEVNPY